MHYVFKNKSDYLKCRRFLDEYKVDYLNFKISNYYLINVFDETLKEWIENKELTFKRTESISLENGYLATKNYKEKSIIKVNDIEIGNGRPVFIAGPCSVEKEDTLREIAIKVKESGADVLRGGAFKPRTSPYEFQGLGKEGVDILYKIGKELDMPVITEILDVRDLDYMIDKVDILQVGTRNMYNYPLIKELGKVDKPILLKRGLSASVKEFLLSAEYIMLEGNEKVILCERGIRNYDTATRNIMDIATIALLKELSHLPIISDPSHATGKRTLISPMVDSSISAGADGVIIETCNNPDAAWSDGKQSICPKELQSIINRHKKFK
ncbi:TPA: 3-deoxy-7-phosphoheptulonate synthase [Clostridioides difficile]